MNPAARQLEAQLCVAADDAERLRLLLALAAELQEQEPARGSDFSGSGIILRAKYSSSQRCAGCDPFFRIGRPPVWRVG
jgi:hypothetical protein